MTDEDRTIHIILTGAYDRLALSLKGGRLSQGDQIEMALMFIDMADRILKRVVDNSRTTEGDVL